MLFLLWCSCVTVWCASPDRVSRCVEVRPAKKVFARPLHALWSKYESKKRGNMSYIQPGGGKKSKKKGRTSPRLYIVPYLHSNVSFLYHAYWTLLERLSTERKSTLEWLRCASVDDCVLYWMCRPHFFFYGAQWVQRVFFVVLTLLRRNGVGAWKAP